MENLRSFDKFETVEGHGFFHPMDYTDAFSLCGDDFERDDAFLDDSHIWFSIYLEEIPFLFNSTGKLRKTSVGLPARQCQPGLHRRRISTSNALLPSSNKIRLQELANTELLVSLNEPFGKNESEQEISEDEKDGGDFALSEKENEQQKLVALKRVKVIEEIFETEKKYIACLNTVDKVFKVPMLCLGVAQEKDVNALFPSCLATINECHSWFMEQLENRMKCEDWSGGIGDILGKMAGPLKENLLNIYTDYVNAFPKSISTFSKCSRGSQKFRRFIEECYCKCDNLDLPSYLITPVQRLPRYVLLLRQLSKYTHEGHPDSESIKKALNQMEELISSLNSSIHNSMQAYTARESDTRKNIRRQLSRRRKKPRPLSLNLKEMKERDDKQTKASPSDQNDNRLPQIDTLSNKPRRAGEQSPSDERDNEGSISAQNQKTNLFPNDHLSPSVQLRKSKSEGKKSFRRSLGAALSSLWSPREDKDSKNVQENTNKESSKLEDTVEGDAKVQGSMRRKVGVSYPIPSQAADPNSTAITETPKLDGEVVKRRRFSGSFREKTRNFRIQMRRRSGSWFSAAADKSSDSDLTSDPSSATNIPTISVSEDASLDESSLSISSRNNKSRSSFVSIFSKRKSKYFAEEGAEPVTRRRSECNRQIDPDELLNKQLSTSVSVPVIAYHSRESNDSRVAEVISEESIDNANEANGFTSALDRDVQNGKSPCAQTIVGNRSPVLRENFVGATEKKHKKGKIMKTLRNIIGKGNN